jgi:RNA polymerase sigma-70 factor, ECF subfamily
VEARVHNSTTVDLASPDGFRAFYLEALPRVYGYFYNRSGANKSVAEDLTQETFLAAAKEIRYGKTIEHPLPWVVGIARHKLLDHFRRDRTAQFTVLITDDEAHGESDEPIPELDISNREVVLVALAAVPSPQRDVLILHYMDGLSIQEAALALGRSRTATASLLARARHAFRERYLEADHGD